MKIVSSNIRFDSARDGALSWAHRREFLAKNLLSYGPELIATQEGWQAQLQDLASLLPQYHLVDEHRSWIAERMYPCIFIKTNLISVFDKGDFWLSKTPSIAGSSSFKSSYPRLATWIKAKHKQSDFSFFFINTHLDHVLSSTREEQIKVLFHEMNLINKEKLPCILCGDFNEGPHEKVRELIKLQAPELYDPWFKLDQAETPSHHRFGPPPKDANRIDWFMVDHGFDCEEVFLDHSKEKNIYPSDHYPLKLKLKLPKA